MVRPIRSHTEFSAPSRPHAPLRVLKKIAPNDIAEMHPVRRLGRVYAALKERCAPQHLPDFDELAIAMGRELLEHCLVLSPIDADPFIDFLILRRGNKIPGLENCGFVAGERYSDHILPVLAEERLMELASSLALKQWRHTVGMSARVSSLSIKVYRGVFPVWDGQLERHNVVLAIAPVYAKLSYEAVPKSD